MRYLVDARAMADPSGGGVSRVARGLVEAFIELVKNDEVVLVTTGCVGANLAFALGDHKDRPYNKIQHIHLPIPNKLWSAACVCDLTSLDREVEKRVGKIDAVFLPNLGFVGSLSTKHYALCTPYTLLLHDLSFLIEPKWFSRKMRWWHKAVNATRLIRSAAHLLAVSETTKRDAMRLLRIPEEKISVIPIGMSLRGVRRLADDEAIRREASSRAQRGISSERSPRFARDNRYVLALGSNDPRKNTSTAEIAVRELRKEKEFENLRLIIPHRVSDSELSALYAGASAFLYPSWYEGYGLPLHEAAIFGTPCVASTAGALPETAPPGTLFADPAKPHHWVEALKLALTRPRPIPFIPKTEYWTEAASILQKTLFKTCKHF